MSPSPKKPQTRKPTARQLVKTVCQQATALERAGSLFEHRVREKQLMLTVDDLFDRGKEELLADALDRLAEEESPALDRLLDCFEHKAQCRGRDTALAPEGGLFLFPLLIWSRFVIPTPRLSEAQAKSIADLLHTYVFGDDVAICLLDTLPGMPNLPQGFIETGRLAADLEARLQEGRLYTSSRHVHGPFDAPPDFLSDVRYVVGFFQPKVAPWVFPWQIEDEEGMPSAFLKGVGAVRAQFSGLFPACVIDPVVPDLYFVAHQRVEALIRPHALHSSVSFLVTQFDRPARDFHATIAAFSSEDEGEGHIEARIGFGFRDERTLLHGLIWPLGIGENERLAESLDELEQFLHLYQLDRTFVIDGIFPMEYCEDCGAPYYVSRDGELVHVEPPEETFPHGSTLH
jgi:hypothetical protein